MVSLFTDYVSQYIVENLKFLMFSLVRGATLSNYFGNKALPSFPKMMAPQKKKLLIQRPTAM